MGNRTRPTSVIFLRIVLVSPGTHLVKKHESKFRTSEFHLKRKHKEACWGLNVTSQLIWRQMPKLFITVY